MIQYCLGTIYKEAKKAVKYILKRYYKYKKLQDKQFSERLLKYILQDYIINLKPGTSLKFYPIYKLIKVEQQALKDFVRENLQLKRIRPLQSLAGYLVLFIFKKKQEIQNVY